MDDELVLYSNPMSRGRIARWMLEEVGRPYRMERIELGSGTKAPDYLAINPMGKVPALRHGTTIVTETSAICAYLADAFPDAALAPPPGDRLRGTYYRWLFFVAGPLEAAIADKVLGLEVPQGREAMTGYGSLLRTLEVVERTLSDCEHLVGDRFSAADLVLGAQLRFGMMFRTIDPRPAFERFVERLAARPAAIRAAALDDALIAAKPAAP